MQFVVGCPPRGVLGLVKVFCCGGFGIYCFLLTQSFFWFVAVVGEMSLVFTLGFDQGPLIAKNSGDLRFSGLSIFFFFFDVENMSGLPVKPGDMGFVS